MIKEISGVRYDTTKAVLLAHDRYWDGHNWERHGRNTFLYRGKSSGRYFLYRTTLWQGERDTIEPLTESEALSAWEQLPEHEVTFEEAFPNAQVEDA